MAINASPTRPGVIAGKAIKRVKEKMLWVKSPKGEVIEIGQSNAFDLVNHNGWTFTVSPAQAAAIAAAESAKADAPAEGGAAGDKKVDETPKDQEPKEPTVIDKLRAEAAQLGVEVDARWGQRTLAEKIAEARAAKA